MGMESSPPGPPAPDRGPDEDERRASPPIPAVPDEPPDDEEERRVAVVADDERCRCCLRAAAAAALIPAMISDGLPSMGLPGLLTSLSMLCRLPAREDGERRRASADALPAVGGDAPLPCLLRDTGVSLARGLALGSEGRAAALAALSILIIGNGDSAASAGLRAGRGWARWGPPRSPDDAARP